MTRPLEEEFLPYGRQSVTEEDVAAVAEVLRSDWLTTGPAVEAFEAQVAEAAGTEHAVALSSGTAALHAAYEAAGVGPGDQVIVPALTFSATANVARHLGAEICFADVSGETLTLDPADAAARITDATRAVVAVDYAGHPADLDALREVADGADAVLVEDAAHSLGGAHRGRPVGADADLATFSFHPVKVVTSGEGGAVVTDDGDRAGRVRHFRDHGIDRSVAGLPDDPEGGDWLYDIERPGLNYRLTDLQSALGASQLQRLDSHVRRRREIADRYRDRLQGVRGLELPPEADWCRHPYHLFVVRVPPERRTSLYRGLRERGIGVQVHYVPVNMLSAYRERGHDPRNTPVALETYRRALSLPCFPAMEETDVDRVAEAVSEVLEAQGRTPGG